MNFEITPEAYDVFRALAVYLATTANHTAYTNSDEQNSFMEQIENNLFTPENASMLMEYMSLSLSKFLYLHNQGNEEQARECLTKLIQTIQQGLSLYMIHVLHNSMNLAGVPSLPTNPE